MKGTKSLIGLAFAAALPSLAWAQAAFVTDRNITAEAAMQSAMGALERCLQGGYQRTVPVVKTTGRVKAVVADDNAGPHTNENSFRKAYSAITFKTDTEALQKRFGASPPPHPILLLANVTTGDGA